MLDAPKILLAAGILSVALGVYYFAVKPSTDKVVTYDQNKEITAKDPIMREYIAKINDPAELTYAEPGSQINTLHTQQEYIAKTINMLTKRLHASLRHPKKKLDLQKRLRVLTEIKKTLK